MATTCGTGRPASTPGPHEPEPEPEVEAIGHCADLKVTNSSYHVPMVFDVLKSQDPLHVLLQYIAEVRLSLVIEHASI
jgi:hypothetical protein